MSQKFITCSKYAVTAIMAAIISGMTTFFAMAGQIESLQSKAEAAESWAEALEIQANEMLASFETAHQ